MDTQTPASTSSEQTATPANAGAAIKEGKRDAKGRLILQENVQLVIQASIRVKK